MRNLLGKMSFSWRFFAWNDAEENLHPLPGYVPDGIWIELDAKLLVREKTMTCADTGTVHSPKELRQHFLRLVKENVRQQLKALENSIFVNAVPVLKADRSDFNRRT